MDSASSERFWICALKGPGGSAHEAGKKNSLRKHYLKNLRKPLHLTRWQIFTNLPKIMDGSVKAEARAANAASMLGVHLFCRAADYSPQILQMRYSWSQKVSFRISGQNFKLKGIEVALPLPRWEWWGSLPVISFRLPRECQQILPCIQGLPYRI